MNLNGKLLREILFLGVMGLLVFLGSHFSPRVPEPRDTNSLPAVVPLDIISLINKERSQAGEATLRENLVLTQAAQMKASDMAKKGYFAHTSPEGKILSSWLGEVGYVYINAGENLAVSFSDSASLVEAWMNSPGHRGNILNGTYTETGVGIAKGTYEDKETTFIVQFFGTPLDLPTFGYNSYWIPSSNNFWLW